MGKISGGNIVGEVSRGNVRGNVRGMSGGMSKGGNVQDQTTLLLTHSYTSLFAYEQDLNSETLLHIYAESKQQSLEEELKFLKTIHEQVLYNQSPLTY